MNRYKKKTGKLIIFIPVIKNVFKKETTQSKPG